MNIHDALAKSNGIKLLKHNKNVSIASRYLYKYITNNIDNNILKIIEISSLLHDIGKMTEMFQEILSTNKKDKKYKDNKFAHNEIAWAFLHEHLKINSNLKKYIINNIYWHHGISKKMSKYTSNDILESEFVSEDSIDLMRQIVSELLDETYLKNPEFNPKKSPSYYIYDDENIINDDYNEIFGITHTCIVNADKIISELEETYLELDLSKEEYLNLYIKYVKIELYKKENLNLNNFPYGDSNINRFNKQKEIVKQCKKTTIIKAPAGFGKTLLGMLWASKSNKKTTWVCPRNVVAKSVYDSILNELKEFKETNVKIELFLNNTVLEKNHDNDDVFNSDIIITNIDNFESPTFKDNISKRLFTILSANVVFDEYHEFISTLPIFSNFINIMRMRHRYTNSNNLLLSATPINIEYFWDTINNQTSILPNKHEHYEAKHNDKYLIRVQKEFNYDLKGSDLVISNTISNSQRIKANTNSQILYHSGFVDERKNDIYNEIFSKFNKYSGNNTNKVSVTSSLIMQASLDVSFNKLYESVLSPEASMQRLGRCNRFGNFSEQSIYTIFKENNKSNDFVVGIFYKEYLRDLWYDEMKQYNNRELTLNELYDIYNSHTTKYKNKRKILFNQMFIESSDRLKNIYPFKFKSKNEDNNIISAGSNKLRCNGNEIFCIVKHYNKNEFVGPFNTTIYNSFVKDFNEDSNTLKKMKKTIEFLSTNKNFDYSELTKNKYKFKNLTIDHLRIYGKKSNTPYIRFDKVYHPEFGLINIEDLNIG